MLVVASWLGNGIFWYALALSLPLIYGRSALFTTVRGVIVGLVGVAVYKCVKSRLVRERPYISLEGIVPGAKPLDRYSFPSGHTLHAFSFSILAVAGYPELAWVCVPLTMLIALSRVMLGLHYPSDVVAGALLGSALACLGIMAIPADAFAPYLHFL